LIAAQPNELLAAIGVQMETTLDARRLQNRHNPIERRDWKMRFESSVFDGKFLLDESMMMPKSEKYQDQTNMGRRVRLPMPTNHIRCHRRLSLQQHQHALRR
jgi:hypothetical protein